jgi:hypothetical protein
MPHDKKQHTQGRFAPDFEACCLALSDRNAKQPTSSAIQQGVERDLPPLLDCL